MIRKVYLHCIDQFYVSSLSILRIDHTGDLMTDHHHLQHSWIQFPPLQELSVMRKVFSAGVQVSEQCWRRM